MVQREKTNFAFFIRCMRVDVYVCLGVCGCYVAGVFVCVRARRYCTVFIIVCLSLIKRCDSNRTQLDMSLI